MPGAAARKGTIPGTTTSEETTPKGAIPGAATSEEMTPQGISPDATTPEEATRGAANSGSAVLARRAARLSSELAGFGAPAGGSCGANGLGVSS